jgi:hypothetical protein
MRLMPSSTWTWSGMQDSNLRPHDPQSCALPGCANARNSWCRRRDSNTRPTVYETVALPAELRRRNELTWCRRRGSNTRPAVYKTAALPTELRRPAVFQRASGGPCTHGAGLPPSCRGPRASGAETSRLPRRPVVRRSSVRPAGPDPDAARPALRGAPPRTSMPARERMSRTGGSLPVRRGRGDWRTLKDSNPQPADP